MRIVICGGGVIGACVAYFLNLRAAQVVVVERTSVACAASGKSGGFLALDWCDGSPLAPLARRSYALHAELAAALPNRWGYRRLETLSVMASAKRRLRQSDRALPAWVNGEAVLHRQIGDQQTTAQLDPAAFTSGMMAAAQARGTELRKGEVTGVVLSDEQRVAAVEVDGAPVACDAVVITMGPWSALATSWLPLPMVYGLQGNSLVFRGDVSAHALFVDCEAPDGGVESPEVFPRPDGTVYVCGLSSQAPLPIDPAEVAPDAGARARLVDMTATFAPRLAQAEVVAEQACYRPVTRDGLPLIGAVPGIEGAYVATGHSVWGMLNAPATGEAMAGLILDGQAHGVDLAPFDPARLPLAGRVRLRD